MKFDLTRPWPAGPRWIVGRQTLLMGTLLTPHFTPAALSTVFQLLTFNLGAKPFLRHEHILKNRGGHIPKKAASVFRDFDLRQNLIEIHLHLTSGALIVLAFCSSIEVYGRKTKIAFRSK